MIKRAVNEREQMAWNGREAQAEESIRNVEGKECVRTRLTVKSRFNYRKVCATMLRFTALVCVCECVGVQIFRNVLAHM